VREAVRFEAVYPQKNLRLLESGVESKFLSDLFVANEKSKLILVSRGGRSGSVIAALFKD
jgi:hypothetical protein